MVVLWPRYEVLQFGILSFGKGERLPELSYTWNVSVCITFRELLTYVPQLYCMVGCMFSLATEEVYFACEKQRVWILSTIEVLHVANCGYREAANDRGASMAVCDVQCPRSLDYECGLPCFYFLCVVGSLKRSMLLAK